ncbi:MAG: helix-turn-helix domain-containing protein [Oscillospiraceae bacterium]
MEDKRTLGEYIAQRRRALGMTQRQFAEKLYVTDSAVSKWERGLSYPDITLLHDICRVLEVSEHELLTASEDTEVRRSETLARRYIRLVRGWKFGQIACYALAAVISFIADLASDGALGWAWVVLASLLTAASLTLTPPRAGAHGRRLTAGASRSRLELLLGVCCLYTAGTGSSWPDICASALPGAAALCAQAAAAAGGAGLAQDAVCLGADLALLLALGVCCVYAGGDRFWITAVSVIFAAAVLLLPFVMKQLPLPEALRRHSAALWLGTVSLLLFVLLGAACLYDGGDWFLLPALPMAVYGLLLPWGVLVLARYLRAGGWFRAAAAFGFMAVWYWLFPWVLDRVMALDGRYMDPPYSLLRPFGFDLAHWDAAGTASNVMMLILAALILIALALAAVGMLRRRK